MNTENQDSSSDVQAAFAAAAANPTPSEPSAPAVVVGVDEPLVPATARDEAGRFAPKNPASPAVPGAPGDTPTGVGATATPPGQPGAAPEAGTTPPAATQPAAVDPNAPQIFDKAKPPSAWTPEMKAKWETLPEDIRAEVTRREEASYQGFEKFRKQAEPALQIYDQVSRHGDYFNHIQKNPQEYLAEVIESEKALALGNPAQKLEQLLDIADGYGIPVRQILDDALKDVGGIDKMLQEGHAHHKSPPRLPPEVQRELNEARQWRESQMAETAQREVERMGADKVKYPLFEEARESMAAIMGSGVVKSLDEAYELAIFKNPELRSKAFAIQNGAAQQNGVAQRQQAAAAVASPGATAAVPPKPADADESTEDTIRRLMNAGSSGRV